MTMPFKAARGFFAALTITALLSAGAAQAETVQIVGFGDSLMAGYQLPAEDAFPVQLEKALKAKGHDVAIANAGVSGDTSSGGLARIDWSVPDGTKGVILELGANDALRGIPPEETEKNLDAMLEKLGGRGIRVLLAGMIAPPNMGADYGERFNGIFARLAEKHGASLYPFFLEGVVTMPDRQLEDGMHPNAKGVAAMVEAILPTAESFLAGIEPGQ
jgi:acyl-CoA thioesterase-1